MTTFNFYDMRVAEKVTQEGKKNVRAVLEMMEKIAADVKPGNTSQSIQAITVTKK